MGWETEGTQEERAKRKRRLRRAAIAWLACWTVWTGLYFAVLVIGSMHHDSWAVGVNTLSGIVALWFIFRGESPLD